MDKYCYKVETFGMEERVLKEFIYSQFSTTFENIFYSNPWIHSYFLYRIHFKPCTFEYD